MWYKTTKNSIFNVKEHFNIKEHFGSNKAKGLLGIPTSQFSRNLKSDVVKKKKF